MHQMMQMQRWWFSDRPRYAHGP